MVIGRLGQRLGRELEPGAETFGALYIVSLDFAVFLNRKVALYVSTFAPQEGYSLTLGRKVFNITKST